MQGTKKLYNSVVKPKKKFLLIGTALTVIGIGAIIAFVAMTVERNKLKIVPFVTCDCTINFDNSTTVSGKVDVARDQHEGGTLTFDAYYNEYPVGYFEIKVPAGGNYYFHETYVETFNYALLRIDPMPEFPIKKKYTTLLSCISAIPVLLFGIVYFKKAAKS